MKTRKARLRRAILAISDWCRRHMHQPRKEWPTIALSLPINERQFDTFIRGDFVYSSTGDVVDAHIRTTVATLRKNNGKRLQSEKMIEVDFLRKAPVRVGNQFGVDEFFLCPRKERCGLRMTALLWYS